jgi:hypothetical protein
MQFRFCPQLEQSCPHVGHCPHLGGAALGTLVTWANTSGDTIDHPHKALDAERERNAKLVEENLRLEKAWEQAKLELKLDVRTNSLPVSRLDAVDHRQPFRLLRPHHVIQPAKFLLQDGAVQK